ncbi:hypothetical protein RB598_001240 [Gaeumannomyces tritici]
MRVSSSTARLAAALSALLPARALAIPGDATFTNGNLASGTCSFSSYSFPPGIYGSGLGPANWAGGAKCGACLQVTGPRGSTKVMIVDSCPSCSGSRLNLFSDAFKLIGDPSDGVIPINYDPISCGIAKPLRLRNKSGTSKWYAASHAAFPSKCLTPTTRSRLSTSVQITDSHGSRRYARSITTLSGKGLLGSKKTLSMSASAAPTAARSSSPTSAPPTRLKPKHL